VRLLARTLPVVSRVEEKLLAGFPEAALKTLQDGLETLRAAAEEYA
jgi:hypothetical protein